MASLSKKIRAHNQRIVEQASRGLPRNPDGSIVEIELRQAVARIVREKLDPDKMAERQAAAIIESCTKQDGEDDEEGDGSAALQLELFGESYSYNPQRLIKDSHGNIIEEDRATLAFVLAELARSSDHMRRATMWNSRKARKAEHFQRWMQQEMAKGRSSLELTWGNCARETGILRGKA